MQGVIANGVTVRIRITSYDLGRGVVSESGDFVVLSDSDQDGLPDFWEKRIVDWYLHDELGTVAHVLPEDRSFLWLTWTVVPQMSYHIFGPDGIFCSDAVSRQVSPVNPAVLSDNGDGTMTWIDRGTSEGMNGMAPGFVRQRFYRIRMTPQEAP